MYFSLKEKYAIQALFKKGTKLHSGSVIIFILAQDTLRHRPRKHATKILCTTSKAIKSKPIKNTLKRRLRVIIQHCFRKIKEDYLIALIAQRPTASYLELKEDTITLLKECGVLNPQ